MERQDAKKSWMLPGSFLGSEPAFFSVWTLYDISPGAVASRENLASLMKIINNRGQPLLAGVDCIDQQDITNSLFGENITGIHRVWCLKWIAERIGQMSEDTLAVDSLGKVLNIGLSETAMLDGRTITTGPNANTFYIQHVSF